MFEEENQLTAKNRSISPFEMVDPEAEWDMIDANDINAHIERMPEDKLSVSELTVECLKHVEEYLKKDSRSRPGESNLYYMPVTKGIPELSDEPLLKRKITQETQSNKSARQITTRLHEAAAKGDAQKVQEYIAAGDDVNDMSEILGAAGTKKIASGGWGRNVTPLHLAAYNGHPNVIRVLVAAGAHLEQRDAWYDVPGQTPFEMTINRRYMDCAQLLKDLGAEDKSNCLESWYTRIDVNDWLGYAAIYKNRSIILELHAHGVMSKEDGEQALRDAARYNALDIAKILLTHCKVSPDTDNNKIGLFHGSRRHDNRTPLGIAAEYGHYEMAKLLLQSGATIDKYTHTTSHQPNLTPLREAVIHIENKKSNAALIKLLLKHDADINKIDDIGLSFLLRSGFADELALLLQHGLDANLIFDKKSLLAHCLGGYQRHELVLTLIQHGADITGFEEQVKKYLQRNGIAEEVILAVTQPGYTAISMPDLSDESDLDLKQDLACQSQSNIVSAMLNLSLIYKATPSAADNQTISMEQCSDSETIASLDDDYIIVVNSCDESRPDTKQCLIM